ncbi:collagen binding domain-containing protein, partial [uncultured Oscillibacter sp.]|uniref:MSCRAMM family protein n=2 Tax=uncultured Oscillibacter sp. TaxID=876091 RepID=UPI002729BBEE
MKKARLTTRLTAAILTLSLLTVPAIAADPPASVVRVNSYKGSTLEIGERSGLMIGPSGAEYTVTSSDPDTVAVEQVMGFWVAVAKAEGTASITAANRAGERGTLTLTVGSGTPAAPAAVDGPSPTEEPNDVRLELVRLINQTRKANGVAELPVSEAIMIGELNIIRQKYDLTVKKVDSTNSNKGLAGARFMVRSENGTFSKEIVTGQDGTYTLSALDAGTYAVTELEAPEGYEIDNAGPQYVVLPSNGNNTVTVTFADTPTITGEGSIRKVDADDPTKGLAGAVIKIEGVDNDFTGTYVTGTGGYLTDVPWKDMPLGSYTAEEVTPPEGYTKSPDVNKTKQTFRWDGKTDIALVFENDAKVKVKLIKLDDSDNPLPGAVFNIIKDGQIIGTEATKADGSITVTDVTE